MYFSKNRRALLKKGLITGLKAGAIAMLPPTTFASQNPSNPYGIAGKQAPELDIPYWIDLQGKPTSFELSDHKGKFVFMEFWQSWCPGCHSHGLPGLKEISDAFKESEYFTAIAIQTTFEGYSRNTPDKVREVQKQYELDIVMGHDAGDEKTHSNPKTITSYRSGGTPWAVLISPQGKVVFNNYSIDPKSLIEVLTREIKKLG